MTVIELKEKLIAKISSIESEGLLDYISKMIDFEQSEEVYEMSLGEIEAVKEGLAQLDNGQWITNDEANRRADEWLKR